MRYQPKGLLHSKRFTTKPRDCGVCSKPLPIPHPTSQRMHDECRFDPVRLEVQRQENRKRERIRDRAQRAAAPPPAPVMRTCQHPLNKKDGPICGIAFEAKPRIDENGVNRGVHADQQYCPKHQTPKAVAHRQWINRNVKNRRKLARKYRNDHLADVRAKQRKAAKAKRARLAAFLAQPAVRLLRARITLAALLTIENMTHRAMRAHLYPKTEGPDRQYDSTKKFFWEHREEVDLEVQRLAAFSDAGRKLLDAPSRQTIFYLSP